MFAFKSEFIFVGGIFKSSILNEIPAFVANLNPKFFKSSARKDVLVIP